MARILDTDKHYLEAVHWEPENPYQLEAFEITMFTFIDANKSIHIAGHAVFTPEGYESVKDIVGSNNADALEIYPMLVRMFGKDIVDMPHHRWWSLYTVGPIDWENDKRREFCLEEYKTMKNRMAKGLGDRLRVKFKEPETLFLNCGADEAEQKIKEANKPWLSFAS